MDITGYKVKIWSVYLDDDHGGKIMHMCLAYDLEEAINHAWAFVKKTCPGTNPMTLLPKMWLSMDANDLTVSTPSLIMETKQNFYGNNEKNELIKTIIKTKDSKLFQKSKRKLNNLEIRYIKEKLDEKPNQ